MPTWLKMVFSFLVTLVVVEAASYGLFKFYYAAIREESSPEVREYYRRGHPLFTDNSDLRAKFLEVDFDRFAGYRFVPNTLHVRPHSEYVSRLEVDDVGFIHNGDPKANAALMGDKEAYRVVFFGGSTMAGRGASDNANTIPALFEKKLRERFPNQKFHILNTGHFGYDTTQERLLYSMYVKWRSPDLLVFLDGVNDAEHPKLLKTWIPYFHDQVSTMINRDIYRQRFSAFDNLKNFAKATLTFPEPLYALALVSRVMKRMEIVKDRYAGTAVFHPEATAQLRDNAESIVLEARAAGTATIFALQPLLVVEKNKKSAIEDKIITSFLTRIPNYDTILARYFTSFGEAYDDLRKKYGGDRTVFMNIVNIFAAEERHIYQSQWHYNNAGNDMIAEAILGKALPIVEADLGRKK